MTSPQVKDDLTALLYLGLLEIDQAKMLKVSSNGKDFLENNPVDEAFKNQLTSLIQELKEKIKAIDEEQRLRSRRRGRGF